MSSTSLTGNGQARGPLSPERCAITGALPRWQRIPSVPLLLAAAIALLTLLPRIAGNPRLVSSFLVVSGLLAGWSALLWARHGSRSRAFAAGFGGVRRQHFIQATVQLCVYAYWGWYWREVYTEAPLFLAQLLFLYGLDALISWSRGRTWSIGFGPLPIVLSTNVFIWFRDDWFLWQFALVATGALGKEFIRWQRDGRRTHVFNPSALPLFLCSILLIATGAHEVTWGFEIATTIFRPPYIYVEIFLLGLVVQYFFGVTLMTLAAAATLVLLNVAYTASTGIYYFIDSNISAAVFLGMHLLMTDPSTSPRSNVGKVVFGALYGLGIWVCYGFLQRIDAPTYFDKLLPIPLLNLGVQAIDRAAKSGMLGRIGRWEAGFRPQRSNLVYMGCWTALFGTLLGTGFVQAPHEGRSIAFWRKAWEEGRDGAGERLLTLCNTRAHKNNSGSAFNALGSLYMEGILLPMDRAAAARCFARACELGHTRGCTNLVRQYLLGEPFTAEVLDGALTRLEAEAESVEDDGESCFVLGFVHEAGKGRPADPARALPYYVLGCERGNLDACKGLVRLRMSGLPVTAGLDRAAELLERAAPRDAQACFYLAFLLDTGIGVPRDAKRSRELLEQACSLGHAEACTALGAR